MISYAIALLSLTQINYMQELQNCEKTELRKVPEFVLEDVYKLEEGWPAIVTARRSADGASLTFQFYKVEVGQEAQLWQNLRPAAIYREPYLAFSDLPIGESTRRTASPGAASITTYDNTFLVDVVVAYRGTRKDGKLRWLSQDPEGDKVMVEGLARRCLARLRNLDAKSAASTRIGSSDVPSAIGANGDRLVELDGYAKARGVELSVNERQGTAAFKVRGVQVIIPLAARSIKAGPEWYASKDISIIRNERWYVPLAALEKAYKG